MHWGEDNCAGPHLPYGAIQRKVSRVILYVELSYHGKENENCLVCLIDQVWMDNGDFVFIKNALRLLQQTTGQRQGLGTQLTSLSLQSYS